MKITIGRNSSPFEQGRYVVQIILTKRWSFMVGLYVPISQKQFLRALEDQNND